MKIIKYFKTPKFGDCYVLRNNYSSILSITKNNLSIIANENFYGAYKEIFVDEEKFEEMIKIAKENSFNKRQKLTELLKQIHQKNKVLLDDIQTTCIKVKTRDIDSLANLEEATYFRSYFFNAKPILE